MNREDIQKIVSSYVESPMLVEELWHLIAAPQEPVAEVKAKTDRYGGTFIQQYQALQP